MTEAVATTIASQSHAPSLWIREVVRFPEKGPEDRLQFEPGVNVIVGVPNTGKSKWLRMIDYLFGDDGKPHEIFGDDVSDKYDSLSAILVIQNEDWTIERKWKQPGLLGKVILNGEAMTIASFTHSLMEKLSIPVVHYPQGNPYGPRTWPELGWRSLYRHMFRRQLLWADLADKQPESEQHACLLQFLGIAEVIFSDKYGTLVQLEKQLQQLQTSREQFVAALQDISREILDEKELGVAVTPDSIELAMTRQSAEIEAIQKKRQTLLEELSHEVVPHSLGGAAPIDLISVAGHELAEMRAAEEGCETSLQKALGRLSELAIHRDLIKEELNRMERASEAGSLLAKLKVTHCPACDRPVSKTSGVDEHCYLCHRPNESSDHAETAVKRISFEIAQLRAELAETEQLIGVIKQEEQRLSHDQFRFRERIRLAEAQLRPVRMAAAAVLPAELTVFDQQIGRIQQRMAQLERMRATLAKRETIAADMERIKAEVASLENELNEQFKKLSFERASDYLSDGMNTYLNIINEIKPRAWSMPEITVIMQERSFSIRVGKNSWRSKLGGTLTLLFLMSYHYSLMALSSNEGCHYPGLCVLDFPAQVDGVRVSDSENFVLEPFVRLLSEQAQPNRQLIAAGSSFANLEGANRIALSKVWV